MSEKEKVEVEEDSFEYDGEPLDAFDSSENYWEERNGGAAFRENEEQLWRDADFS